MFGAQDYQAEMEAFQRKTEQDHIIDWVEQEVVKSITPQLVCLRIMITLFNKVVVVVSRCIVHVSLYFVFVFFFA